jgi:hypothetical protein
MSTNFIKIAPVSNFMSGHSVVLKFFHVQGWMDGQDDINGHSTGGANTPKNQTKYILPKYSVL